MGRGRHAGSHEPAALKKARTRVSLTGTIGSTSSSSSSSASSSTTLPAATISLPAPLPGQHLQLQLRVEHVDPAAGSIDLDGPSPVLETPLEDAAANLMQTSGVRRSVFSVLPTFDNGCLASHQRCANGSSVNSFSDYQIGRRLRLHASICCTRCPSPQSATTTANLLQEQIRRKLIHAARALPRLVLRSLRCQHRTWDIGLTGVLNKPWISYEDSYTPLPSRATRTSSMMFCDWLHGRLLVR